MKLNIFSTPCYDVNLCHSCNKTSWCT